jgi:hypothetical protein
MRRRKAKIPPIKKAVTDWPHVESDMDAWREWAKSANSDICANCGVSFKMHTKGKCPLPNPFMEI